MPGGARLARWGLLDRVVARRDAGRAPVGSTSRGRPRGRATRPFEGVDAIYSPRRTVLDAILVDEAREAGPRCGRAPPSTGSGRARTAWCRGVRLRAAARPETVERAALVVGADGRRSLVARTVEAPVVEQAPARTLACYAYWSGVEVGAARSTAARAAPSGLADERRAGDDVRGLAGRASSTRSGPTPRGACWPPWTDAATSASGSRGRSGSSRSGDARPATVRPASSTAPDGRWSATPAW